MGYIILLCVALTLVVQQVAGHGYLIEPPNRGSLWRDPTFTSLKLKANYDDNANNCGGAGPQANDFFGKCGLCGDSYGLPAPRKNELGGELDVANNGLIARTYKEGANIPAAVEITAPHLGFFNFSLCNLDVHGVESEECFDEYHVPLINNEPVFHVYKEINVAMRHIMYLTLPEGLVCERCVLRWHYHAGNSWGVCDNGEQGIGCGNQENFKTCTDISIKKRS